MRAAYKVAKKGKNGVQEGVIVIIVIILLVVIVRLALLGSAFASLIVNSMKAEVYEDTDVSHYLWYMGDGAKEEYVRKWGMDESIFPEDISNNMNILDYKMVYYDPWDAQYLSYLVAEYDQEGYKQEEERLKQYASTEYLGYFCAEGFSDEYTLLAMRANPDYGLIYAISAEKNQIVYVEMIFCNYFYDIDYKSMIPEEYLPVGFDATVESPYRQQRLGHK